MLHSSPKRDRQKKDEGDFSTSPWNMAHRKALALAEGGGKDMAFGLSETFNFPESQEQTQQQGSSEQNYLPSLLLDALGGGRRPSKSPKSSLSGSAGGPFAFQEKSRSRKASGETFSFGHSPGHSGHANGWNQALSYSLQDDDAPPSQSLFAMSPGDMRVSELQSIQQPASLYPPLYPPVGTPSGVASTPVSSRSASKGGSPMDFSYSRPGSSLANSVTPSQGFSQGTPMSTSNTPLKAQTTVTLMGFPSSKWRQVLDFAKSMDTVLSFRKSDDEHGNWLVVTFSTAKGLAKMREYDGQLCDGSWFLTVRLGDMVAPSAALAIQVTGGLEATSASSPQQPKLSPMRMYKPSPISTVPSSPAVVSKKKVLALHKPPVSASPLGGSPLFPDRYPNKPQDSKTKLASLQKKKQQENVRPSMPFVDSMEEEDEEEDVQPSLIHTIMDFFTW